MHFVAILFFLLMGAWFSFTLVRGLMRGKLPSKFGPSLRAKEPIIFAMNAVMHGFFALAIFFAAFSLSLGNWP